MSSNNIFCSLGGAKELNWHTEVAGIATLKEFVKNDRFIIASCDPYMSRTLKICCTVYLKNDTKDGFKKNY
jgi:hypothetical protein